MCVRAFACATSDMATMLAFVLTDVAVPRAELQAMLARAADASFNAASVDADQSTSDTLVCLSSGAALGRPPLDAAGRAEFEAALTELCAALAEDVVRNGEGTAHVQPGASLRPSAEFPFNASNLNLVLDPVDTLSVLFKF